MNTSERDIMFNHIADDIANHGYCILPDFFEPTLINKLAVHIGALDPSSLNAAGIGRDNDFQLAKAIRSDKTLWLDESNPIDAEFLAFMEAFRAAINQRLFLGLFDYESHYAVYQPGAFYKKHVDAFKGKSNRVLSTVTYLNPSWQKADGGELLLYKPDSNEVLETITPHLGTLVIFLSEQFPHEVLAANKERYSIAGWFKINK